MKSKQYSPNETVAWRNLEALAQDSTKTTIADLFKLEADRAEKMSVETGGLVLDFSKNLVSQDVLAELMALVDESNLETHRDAMFAGESINSTEDRAVLHATLRAEPEDANTPQEKERNKLVKTQLDHVREVSEKIRSGGWQGSTGKSITDIVNIGIGGSDLGPKLACNGLSEFAHPDINIHFISNVDGAEILTTLAKLNPETTLITVASKTFTTQETLLNAKTAISWFEKKLGLLSAQSSPHFIALTANRDNAVSYGIPESQILEFAEWVGGRYSLWSSIGLSIAISIGFERFSDMLAGAREMDLHFRTAPIDQNMPIIMAVLGIWYTNFSSTFLLTTVGYGK